MTTNAIVQFSLFLFAIVALAVPLGSYMARVYRGEAKHAQRVLGPKWIATRRPPRPTPGDPLHQRRRQGLASYMERTYRPATN